MSDALMKYETIDAAQIKDIMAGRVPREPDGWNDDITPKSGDGSGKVKADDEVKPDDSDTIGDPDPAGQH